MPMLPKPPKPGLPKPSLKKPAPIKKKALSKVATVPKGKVLAKRSNLVSTGGRPKPTPKKTIKPTPKPKGPRKMPSEAELRKGYNESAAGKRGGKSYGDYVLYLRKIYGYKNQMDYPKR